MCIRDRNVASSAGAADIAVGRWTNNNSGDEWVVLNRDLRTERLVLPGTHYGVGFALSPDGTRALWVSGCLLYTSTLRGTSCGMHCFTQVVRNLFKEGDSASIYDRMVAELRKKAPDGTLLAGNNRPVLTTKASEFVPSLKTILDTAKKNKTTPLWDADGETFFKFWYPVWVLWLSLIHI